MPNENKTSQKTSGNAFESSKLFTEKIIITNKEKNMRANLMRAPRPRIASTIVLTIGPKNNPKILMGQRAKRHDFMPDVYVFPGGRVDRGDSYVKYEGDLSPKTETILEAAYSPRKARAVALAAIRETYEETALMLGVPQSARSKKHSDPSWQAFYDAGQCPTLDGIEIFGRAITPPHRHKRFDTWFFIKHLELDTPPPTSDSSELLNVGWFTFDAIKTLDCQRATVMMLQVLKRYLDGQSDPDKIFYSRMERGQYRQGEFP